MDSLSLDQLVERARRGDADALGTMLAKYRPYLRVLAQRHLDSAVKVRVDESDVVQQTCLEAHRDLTQFRGQDEREFLAWLKRILEHNIAQTVERHVRAQKRDVKRVKSLDASHAQMPRARDAIPGDVSSPSQRVMRGEAAIRLARALEALPDDQREAVRLRHLEGLPLADIATRMQRSEVAVAGLMKRGLKKLREQLAADAANDR